METALTDYPPNDNFVLLLSKMTLRDFSTDLVQLEGKALRNAYDNRLRPRNLQIYYLIACLDELTDKYETLKHKHLTLQQSTETLA